ncbi:hypothetical protein BCR37DRAFT_153873 [Protomyces lactucae-debilis]|uniref:Enoyl reductase (ER) domain-containing protein n=1 Tax=Protomyces lactucae-debilis TaxID=2754530 RepID=A0A1Y2F1K3_PROLT|nr:uncharacterized protein BCR37DRAFT_153873 [Protomyces lactucae-debilis]ORY77374.1 hypothetical protein BCR37DRAFT_153873 [Protomyces lactucae-debilis]
MPSSNNAILFKKPPTEYPVAGEHLEYVERPYEFDELKDGEFIAETLYVSIDPYQRGRMRAPEKKSYSPPFTIGQPIVNQGVARVTESKSAKHKVGDIVFGMLDWAEYTKIGAEQAAVYRVIDNNGDIPLSNYVSAVGMPGMTAFSSFYEIGKPKKGETIYINAASGAVGQLVGQLAKREGLRVVGSAGSDAKVEGLIKDSKFDAAFNYKTESIPEALKKYCPDGIDIVFENVGGEQLEAEIDAANNHARFIMCGMISQYNTQKPYGIKNLMSVVGKRLIFQGFIVSDFWAKYASEFYTKVPQWIKNGEVHYREDITDGLQNGPQAFINMLNGKNHGKAMIRVKAE